MVNSRKRRSSISPERSQHAADGPESKKRKLNGVAPSAAPSSQPATDDPPKPPSPEPDASDSSTTLDGDTPPSKKDKGKGKAVERDPILDEVEHLRREIAFKDELLKERERSLSGITQSLECRICIEILNTPYALAPCGHVFCYSCLVSWFTQQPQNPQNNDGGGEDVIWPEQGSDGESVYSAPPTFSEDENGEVSGSGNRNGEASGSGNRTGEGSGSGNRTGEGSGNRNRNRIGEGSRNPVVPQPHQQYPNCIGLLKICPHCRCIVKERPVPVYVLKDIAGIIRATTEEANKDDSAKDQKDDSAKDGDDAPKDKDDAQKDKDDASKDKDDASKDKDDASKDKDDASKDKGDASKDKDDASKDKADASKDKKGDAKKPPMDPWGGIFPPPPGGGGGGGGPGGPDGGGGAGGAGGRGGHSADEGSEGEEVLDEAQAARRRARAARDTRSAWDSEDDMYDYNSPRLPPPGRLRPIRDDEDGVHRCGFCLHEIWHGQCSNPRCTAPRSDESGAEGEAGPSSSRSVQEGPVAGPSSGRGIQGGAVAGPSSSRSIQGGAVAGPSTRSAPRHSIYAPAPRIYDDDGDDEDEYDSSFIDDDDREQHNRVVAAAAAVAAAAIPTYAFSDDSSDEEDDFVSGPSRRWPEDGRHADQETIVISSDEGGVPQAGISTAVRRGRRGRRIVDDEEEEKEVEGDVRSVGDEQASGDPANDGSDVPSSTAPPQPIVIDDDENYSEVPYPWDEVNEEKDEEPEGGSNDEDDSEDVA